MESLCTEGKTCTFECTLAGTQLLMTYSSGPKCSLVLWYMSAIYVDAHQIYRYQCNGAIWLEALLLSCDFPLPHSFYHASPMTNFSLLPSYSCEDTDNVYVIKLTIFLTICSKQQTDYYFWYWHLSPSVKPRFPIYLCIWSSPRPFILQANFLVWYNWLVIVIVFLFVVNRIIKWGMCALD